MANTVTRDGSCTGEALSHRMTTTIRSGQLVRTSVLSPFSYDREIEFRAGRIKHTSPPHPNLRSAHGCHTAPS